MLLIRCNGVISHTGMDYPNKSTGVLKHHPDHMQKSIDVNLDINLTKCIRELVIRSGQRRISQIRMVQPTPLSRAIVN